MTSDQHVSIQQPWRTDFTSALRTKSLPAGKTATEAIVMANYKLLDDLFNNPGWCSCQPYTESKRMKSKLEIVMSHKASDVASDSDYRNHL
jgi:hypothetical protein